MVESCVFFKEGTVFGHHFFLILFLSNNWQAAGFRAFDVVAARIALSGVCPRLLPQQVFRDFCCLC